MIAITRPRYRERSEPTRDLNTGEVLSDAVLLGDLITLAHEYGHHVSWQAGYRSPPYVAAMMQMERFFAGEDVPPLTDQERALVLAEEQRAWDGGRAVLLELGFCRFDVFDEREMTGLDRYRAIFKWELEPAHVRRIEEWCVDRHGDGSPIRDFHGARRTYVDTLMARHDAQADRDAEYLAEVWPHERRAIEAIRRHARGDAAQAAIVAAVQACVDAYRID